MVSPCFARFWFHSPVFLPGFARFLPRFCLKMPVFCPFLPGSFGFVQIRQDSFGFVRTLFAWFRPSLLGTKQSQSRRPSPWTLVSGQDHTSQAMQSGSQECLLTPARSYHALHPAVPSSCREDRLAPSLQLHGLQVDPHLPPRGPSLKRRRPHTDRHRQALQALK